MLKLRTQVTTIDLRTLVRRRRQEKSQAFRLNQLIFHFVDISIDYNQSVDYRRFEPILGSIFSVKINKEADLFIISGKQNKQGEPRENPSTESCGETMGNKPKRG